MSQTITPTPAKPTTVNEAEAFASAEAVKVETFFEAHPKAIAIGSAIAGALVMLAVIHFIP